MGVLLVDERLFIEKYTINEFNFERQLGKYCNLAQNCDYNSPRSIN